MATQLARKGPIERLQEHMPLFLSERVLLGGFAFFVALGLFGLLAGLHNEHRAEEAARSRFADAQTLGSLPPASTDSIRDDLAIVKDQLATAQAEATPRSAWASRDAGATALVRGAQSAGLSVKALSSVAAGQLKVDDEAYTSQGIRLTVEGDIGQITTFLDALHRDEPAVVPELISMTINESGVAHAEIVFSTFEKITVPTPKPVATPKGRAS